MNTTFKQLSINKEMDYINSKEFENDLVEVELTTLNCEEYNLNLPLSNIINLKINHSKISNLNIIGNFSQLKHLTLSNCNISNIYIESGLSNLVSLNIKSCFISENITIVEKKLDNLTHIIIYDSFIKNLDFKNHELNKLENITIENCNVCKLHFGDLKNLYNISIDSNINTDFYIRSLNDNKMGIFCINSHIILPKSIKSTILNMLENKKTILYNYFEDDIEFFNKIDNIEQFQWYNIVSSKNARNI